MNAPQVRVKMAQNVLTFTTALVANVPLDTKETPANLVGKSSRYSRHVKLFKIVRNRILLRGF